MSDWILDGLNYVASHIYGGLNFYQAIANRFLRDLEAKVRAVPFEVAHPRLDVLQVPAEFQLDAGGTSPLRVQLSLQAGLTVEFLKSADCVKGREAEFLALIRNLTCLADMASSSSPAAPARCSSAWCIPIRWRWCTMARWRSRAWRWNLPGPSRPARRRKCRSSPPRRCRRSWPG